MRLRSLSHIDTIERMCDPLLSMPRFGRLAAAIRLRFNDRPVRPDSSWTRSTLDGDRAAARSIPTIQNELDRRLAAAREADPAKRREEAVRRDLIRIRKSIDRLLTAYQEGLLALDELRERMPNLRRREQADNAELQAIVDQSVDRAAYLRLAEMLTTFLTRLRSSAGALDVSERQGLMRLLVKEILVGDDKIIIRHCIPLPMGPVDGRRPSVRTLPCPALKVIFCVRGAISPILSNLFLHYTFDIWMARNHPNIPFERYADDAICHCRSEAQARTLRASLEKRFAQCGLTLHPDKTKVVYCKDDDRCGDHPDHKFDFLGIRFGRGCRAEGMGSASRSVRRSAAKLSNRSGKPSDTGRSINAATRRSPIWHGCSTTISAAGSITTVVSTSRLSIPPCATSTVSWHDGRIGSSSR